MDVDSLSCDLFNLHDHRLRKCGVCVDVVRERHMEWFQRGLRAGLEVNEWVTPLLCCGCRNMCA